ncbi:PAS domain-containing protein [Streptomyces sp. ACA25]|uniref:response regulator n=1 Tax=Streptomyces sp. ACA25 TaxID=3022596 RepID=UPI0023080207|nr:PAS domain-containing protein [Streptomyces sp. ACA25]MDB1086150.1 PAS domain-containing protein [Streptomyces sp. ACA25]
MSSRPARGAARLAAILDALPDALLLVNGNGTIVNANAIATETLEGPGTPLVGRGLLDIIPGFDPRRIPGSMRRPDDDTGTRTKPTRMVARRTDGRELQVEVTSTNLQAGHTPYASAIEAVFADDHDGEELLMLVVRDLSGALDTEAELVRQQRQTEMILRASSEGVVGVDTAGRIVLVNPAAAQILGHRASRLGGEKLHPLAHHSRPDGSPLPFEETPLHDTLTSGLKHRVRGQVLWTKDGRPVPVNMTTAPVRDGDQLVGAVLAFTDRRPFDALAARHAQLLAVLGEGLRGPLDQLRGELTELAADPAGQLWPEANQVLHHLAAGYARMTTLVDNVLSYQRLDEGREKLARKRVSLDSVVAAGVEGATELIGPGRAQFAVHAPPIEAEVDPDRLAQALAHLVADVAGVDATGRAHSGPAGDSTIVVAAAQRGDVVRIEVRGPHSGGDPVHEPLVRGIVRQHGGVLQTHAVPGAAGGRAYVLEVPISANGTPAPAVAPARDTGGETTVMPVPVQPMRGGTPAAASGAPGTGPHDTPPEEPPTGRRRRRQSGEETPAEPVPVPATGGGRRRRAMASAEGGDEAQPEEATPAEGTALPMPAGPSAVPAEPPTGRRRRAAGAPEGDTLGGRPAENGTAPSIVPAPPRPAPAPAPPPAPEPGPQPRPETPPAVESPAAQQPIALGPASEPAPEPDPELPAGQHPAPAAAPATSAASPAEAAAGPPEEEPEIRPADPVVVARSPILDGSAPPQPSARRPHQALPMPGSDRAGGEARTSGVNVRTLGQGIPVSQLTEHRPGNRPPAGAGTPPHGTAPSRRRKLATPPAEDAPRPAPAPPSVPHPASRGREFTISAPAEGSAEGPEHLDGPNGAVEVTNGRGLRLPGPADDELPPEPLDNPRRLLVWPEPDVSTQQALTDRGYRPVLVQSREEVDAQIAAYPAALFVDPLTGPITRTALQSLRAAAVAAEVPVLVTAGLGQASREAAYGADPAVLLKALAPRDSEQHPPRVLLVEEQHTIAGALQSSLERRGMQVAHAVSDSEAAEVAAQMRPNLVVMDLNQVRRRRAGIIDWLRDNGLLNRTPFVVYTSAGLDPAQLSQLASGETVLFLAERSTSEEVQARIVDLLAKIGAA